MIDWTGTYIITYDIIFSMKKGLTWVARQVWKLPKEGGCNPLNPPLGSASVIGLWLETFGVLDRWLLIGGDRLWEVVAYGCLMVGPQYSDLKLILLCAS